MNQEKTDQTKDDRKIEAVKSLYAAKSNLYNAGFSLAAICMFETVKKIKDLEAKIDLVYREIAESISK